jgi:AcrR family transcriptional regulator
LAETAQNAGNRRVSERALPAKCEDARALAADPDAQERERRLATEPARRILIAARRLIARRGIDRSHVIDIANEAGVARGLVSYYFGTKDRLLGEVMEADARARTERLRELLTPTGTLEQVIEALRHALREFMEQEPGAHMALQELATLAMRKPEFQERRAELFAAYRDTLAELLAERQRRGVLELGGDPEAVAALLIALGHGLATDAAADPEWDATPALNLACAVTRRLLAS